MGNDKTNKKSGNAGKGKKAKVPELEDFFTISIAKKNRNVEKKIKHIEEVLTQHKVDKVVLTAAQVEMVGRMPELEAQLAANNAIKSQYLEAYMKRDEEPKTESQTAPVEATPVAPVIDEAEVENRGVRRALNAVSRLLMVSSLLRNTESQNKCFELSGLTNLSSVLEFTTEIFRCNGENENQVTAAQEALFNYVQKTPVLSSSGQSLADLSDLVDSCANSIHFDKFVPLADTPVVIPEPAQPAQASPRKNSEQIMTRSRKESEAQQDIFMAEDEDSDEDNEESTIPTTTTNANPNTNAPQTAQVQQPKPVTETTQAPTTTDQKVTKQKPEKTVTKKGENGGDLDSDEDEWITTSRPAPRGGDYVRGSRGSRGGRGGEGRGRGGEGRGRGGRGYYRGGAEGEGRVRVEGEEGRVRAEGEEGRPWKKDGWKSREGQGENGERRERGEYRGRGEGRGRGDGERGRGGYKGKKPWTTKDGERKPYHKSGEEGKVVDGEGKAPLREIGTVEREAAPAPVEVQAQE
jgi:hypothetical protein